MSLIHWWPLTTDLKDKLSTTSLDTPSQLFEDGKIGKALVLQSTEAFVPNPFIGLSDWSIGFWVMNTGSGNWNDFLCFSGNKARIEVHNDNKSWTWFCDNTTSGAIFTSGTAISHSMTSYTWYHVTIVKSGTNAKFYLDGKCVLEQNVATNFTSDSAAMYFNSRIGSQYANGRYNDIRCYNHALSKKEVQELSRGLVCHYKLDACNNTNMIPNCLTMSGAGGTGTIATDSKTGIVYKGTTKSSTSGDVDFLSWSSVITANYGDVYTISFLGRSSTSTTIRCFLYNNTDGVQINNNIASTGATTASSDGNTPITLTPEWKRYWIIRTFKGSKNNSTTSLTKHVLFRIASGVSGNAEIAQVKLEYGAWDSPLGLKTSETIYNIIEPDCSGYGHDATKYGTLTYSSDTAINGSCTVFPGTAGNYINCHSGGKVKDAITVNWWGYMDNWTSYGRAISCTEGGGWNFEPSGGKMNFACGTGASSNTYKSVVSTTTLASLSAGWHMFTGTYDGFKTKIYIDGKLENTNNAYSTKTPLYYANNSIFLGIEAQGGANNPTSPYFNGRLSDVRIYATALSDAAIQELYTIRWSANKQGQVFSGTVNENQSKFQITRGGVNNCNQVSESGVIPSGYLVLDGIKMERVPWINTGVVFNDATTQIIVAADVTPTATSGNNCLAGCGNSSWTGPVMLNFCGGKLEFGTNGYSTSSEIQGAYTANERLVVHAVIDYNSQKWFKNGVQIKNITSRTCPTTTAPLYIGTFKTPSSSVGNDNSFRGYIHYFEVRYGSIYKKFIPCKRLEDSVLGMYEINEGVFYSPEGGTYTAGKSTTSLGRDGLLYCAEFNEI